MAFRTLFACKKIRLSVSCNYCNSLVSQFGINKLHLHSARLLEEHINNTSCFVQQVRTILVAAEVAVFSRLISAVCLHQTGPDQTRTEQITSSINTEPDVVLITSWLGNIESRLRFGRNPPSLPCRLSPPHSRCTTTLQPRLPQSVSENLRVCV